MRLFCFIALLLLLVPLFILGAPQNNEMTANKKRKEIEHDEVQLLPSTFTPSRNLQSMPWLFGMPGLEGISSGFIINKNVDSKSNLAPLPPFPSSSSQFQRHPNANRGPAPHMNSFRQTPPSANTAGGIFINESKPPLVSPSVNTFNFPAYLHPREHNYLTNYPNNSNIGGTAAAAGAAGIIAALKLEQEYDCPEPIQWLIPGGDDASNKGKAPQL